MMKTIVLTFDRATRALSASDSDAGSVVDNGVTQLFIAPIDGCVIDIVFGVVLREGSKALRGYPFSRVDEQGYAVLYSDVLKACTNGALPISLRLTWDYGGVENSNVIVLKVRYAPDADVRTQVQYSDLAMTRNSSMEWVASWRYPKGSVVTHEGALYICTEDTVGGTPGTSPSWLRASADGEQLAMLKGVRENVQDQLDRKQERIATFDLTAPFGGWAQRADGFWAQTVQHIGLHKGHEVRVMWPRDSYLTCWRADLRVESVADGSAVIVTTEKPDENATITLEEWSNAST